MAQPKKYEVYDKITGVLLAEGTARYCSEVLHVGGDTIRAIAKGKYNSQRFLVEEQKQDLPDEEFEGDTSLKDAAMRWDAFCEPIRKKYGIPVRHLGEGKK